MRELFPESGSHANEFWQRIDDLAQDIARMLRTMKEHDRTALPDRREPPPATPSQQEYDVFISYRRQNGSSEARLVRAELLRQHNIQAFLDVDDLGPGRFNEALLKRIASIPSFIVVLSPNCLERCSDERDWLRQEITQALKTNRKVVPIMAPGFQFPDPESLPAELRALSSHQSVYYSHEYFDAMIAKVIRYLRQD